MCFHKNQRNLLEFTSGYNAIPLFLRKAPTQNLGVEDETGRFVFLLCCMHEIIKFVAIFTRFRIMRLRETGLLLNGKMVFAFAFKVYINYVNQQHDNPRLSFKHLSSSLTSYSAGISPLANCVCHGKICEKKTYCMLFFITPYCD